MINYIATLSCSTFPQHRVLLNHFQFSQLIHNVHVFSLFTEAVILLFTILYQLNLTMNIFLLLPSEKGELCIYF